MEKKRQRVVTVRSYSRLSGLDRTTIQNGLDDGLSLSKIGKRIRRPTSTISNEVKRNRTCAVGDRTGEAVAEVPESACERLKRAPWVCNGCPRKNTICGRVYRCEYSAPRAQRLSMKTRSESRQGIDRTPEQMKKAMEIIRGDLARGMSPVQIAQGRKAQLHASPSTIYRWIKRGYHGLSNLELRRQVGYRPREHRFEPKPTSHGSERSYSAFCALGDEKIAAACEMDTVYGRKLDRKCLLTLYLRASKLQLALPLASRTAEEVERAFDMLETLLGKTDFKRIFGLVLTDNGIEFKDHYALEHSKRSGIRCRVYYCDIRQSQQKGGCERNHVELRKILPKQHFAFDDLDERDLATVMSHLNSQPRPSLGGLCPMDLFTAQYGDVGRRLLEGLGMERIGYEELDLTENLIDRERIARGLPPLRRA